MNLENNKIVHLFHCPSSLARQESLLKVIALPIGARGKLSYRKEWVNEAFIDEVKNININKKYKAIFWVLSCKQNKVENAKDINRFDFACPIRFVKDLDVDLKEGDDNYEINFIAQEFISKFKKMNKKNTLKKMEIEFDDDKIPYPDPGSERGFVYVGPEIDKIETTQTPSLKELYKILENIPCLSNCKTTMKEHPLIKIEAIENSKINENGLYELNISQEYQITLSYYQGENYCDRPIYINNKRFIGKSETGSISIEEKKKGDKINEIDIKFDNHILKIPLYVAGIIPWQDWKFTPLIFTLFLCFIMFRVFIKYFLGSNVQAQATLIIPLLILLADKFFESIKKK
jgi:hypothetical protein